MGREAGQGLGSVINLKMGASGHQFVWGCNDAMHSIDSSLLSSSLYLPSIDRLPSPAGFADSCIRLYDVQLLSARRQQRRDASSHQRGDIAVDDEDAEADEDGLLADRRQAAASAATAAAGGGGGVAAVPPPPPRPSVRLHGHTGPVYALDFTADKRLLLSGSGDGNVRLWSPALGVGLAALRGHMLPVWDVQSCPRGWLLASASADRTAR